MLTTTLPITLKKYLVLIISLLAILTISSCGSDNDSIKINREPTELLIAELGTTEYSIVLNDMNVSDRNSKTLYQHKYHILKLEKDSLVVDSMDWQTVNRDYFEKHEKDLGMEVVSNHNGTLSKVARPVGFGWAIGNEKYGEWEPVGKDSTTTNSNNNNQRRWRSHGPSLLFWYWMLRRPTYQRDYNGYRTANAAGKSYYGTQSNGQSKYGTNSTYQRNKRSSFFSRKKSSNTWRNHTQQKTKRSSSRYNSGSSTRSRSGGFGK